jgi:PAS domain S-box-containing protein
VARLAGVDWLSLRDHPGVAEEGSGARLLAAGIEFLMPLLVEGEVVALVGVGPARDGAPLTSEDLQLLVSFGRHAAVAIAGARLYGALASKVSEVQALKEFNESILESSRVGILVIDRDGRIAGVNRAFETLHGAGRQALLGRPVSGVLPAGTVRAIGDDGARDRALDGAAGAARHDRVPWRTDAGERRLVNLTQSPLCGPDGGCFGSVVTVDDVTEQVRREEDLQRREHLASIGLLASGVAHEVNTPLTGISSYAQILLDRCSADDPGFGLLRKIQQQTQRAAGIASSLLNFARQADGDYQPIDLREMAQETLQLFEPHLKGRRVELHRDLDACLPEVMGNRGRLQQVLMNLLLNAADATPDGGSIAVGASAVNGRVRLQVTDTGTGIAPEHLDRIYDPFFTTKPRGRGTGLGLSVSYGIVKEHSGTLTAESAPGEGSRFIVSLPASGTGPRRIAS